MEEHTYSVIEWFNSLTQKYNRTFVVFDIVDFYPSITESLLRKALMFAQQHIIIDNEKINIIMHARKSLLFNEDEPWMKKEKEGAFDVIMGSYDGAEVCELVGAYILSILGPIIGKSEVGLYRDDGLGAILDTPGPAAERIKKDIIKEFQSLGLKITIDVNQKIVNYLDITMSLSAGTFQPSLKPNARPVYINVGSNYQPQIIKNVPPSVNQRLCSISCNEQVFRDAARSYQDALTSSGHTATLQYTPRPDNTLGGPRRKRQHTPNVIWYTPPLSQSVKTSEGSS